MYSISMLELLDEAQLKPKWTYGSYCLYGSKKDNNVTSCKGNKQLNLKNRDIPVSKLKQDGQKPGTK